MTSIETYDIREFIKNEQGYNVIEGEVSCSREVRKKINFALIGPASAGRRFTLNICDPHFMGKIGFSVGPGKHKCVIESAGSIYAQINMWRNTSLWIGKDTTINFARIIMDESTLKIGEDNLWSDEIIIQTNNQHGIHNLNNMEVVGSGCREMSIEEHVWIGRRALILPGVRIGCGSIIGAGSTVTREVESFCVAAGAPARTVRINSTWSRNPNSFSTKENEWLKKHKK